MRFVMAWRVENDKRLKTYIPCPANQRLRYLIKTTMFSPTTFTAIIDLATGLQGLLSSVLSSVAIIAVTSTPPSRLVLELEWEWEWEWYKPRSHTVFMLLQLLIMAGFVALSVNAQVDITHWQTFATWGHLQRAVQDWAVQDKFSFQLKKKDKILANYVCRIEGCPWELKAAHHRDEDNVEVYWLCTEHNCITSGGTITRKSASHQEWLLEALPRYMKVNSDTAPKQIMECIQLHFHESINYKVAQRAKQNLLTNHLGHHHYAFQLLPAYIE